jgi:hypothetical protein
MSRLDRLLLLVAVALLGGVLTVLLRGGGGAPTRAGPVLVSDSGPGPDAAVTGGATEGSVVGTASASLPAPVRDVAAINAAIARDSLGTYLGDLLQARDFHLARWPSRPTDPVRVWVDERSTAPGFAPAFVDAVRRAFDDWGRAGLPLRFTHISDSARAEVHVTFRERFDTPISGRTRWVRDPNWWIVGGDIELALRTPRERPVTAAQLHAIALHEIGHLLGLDHARDSTTIMSARVHVLQLAPADVATLRLLYTLPPGSVRGD